MDSSGFSALFSACLAALYVLFATLANQRGVGFGRITRFLLWQSLFSAVWQVIQYLKYFDILGFLGSNFLQIEQNLGAFLFFAFFSVVNAEFLGNKSKYYWFPAIGFIGSVFVVSLVIFYKTISSAAINWINLGLAIYWLGLVGITLYSAVVVYTRSELDIQRQRVFIWITANLIIALGGFALIILNQSITGSILGFVGFWLCGYLVFISNHQDFLWSVKRILTFILQGGLGFVIFFLVLRLPIGEGSVIINARDQFEIGTKVFLLLMVVTPTLSMAAESFSRWFLGFSLDQTALIRTFTNKVSGTLSIEILARYATGYIRDILGLEFCTFLLVRKEEKTGSFLLVFYNDLINSTNNAPAFVLQSSSPIAKSFLSCQNPLLKDEILSLFGLLTIVSSDRKWFEDQPYVVYAPIKTENDWLGIYALGPKSSGERFYPRDLELLGAVADQTTSALARAVLYEGTMRLNSDLQAAQTELVRANLKLRELDETKTAFIGVVSHELRTPLANIQFSLQVLEMYYRTQMNEEQKAQFDDLNKAIKQARNMIDNLITFASFLNQQTVLNLTEFEFREVLREALTQSRAQIEAKNLKVHIKIMGDRLCILGDRKLIREAIVQLISNAIKFTPSGDIWVTSWASEDALCFDVKDSGIGIPEEKIDWVWGAFNQFKADAVQRGVEGLGLGLGLVKYIIGAHGGLVWVESKLTVGSTFGFRIPIRGPGYSLEKPPERLKSGSQVY